MAIASPETFGFSRKEPCLTGPLTMTLHYATRMNDEAHGHAQARGGPLGLSTTTHRMEKRHDVTVPQTLFCFRNGSAANAYGRGLGHAKIMPGASVKMRSAGTTHHTFCDVPTCSGTGFDQSAQNFMQTSDIQASPRLPADAKGTSRIKALRPRCLIPG